MKIRRIIEEDLKMNKDQRKALLDHFVGSKAKVCVCVCLLVCVCTVCLFECMSVCTFVCVDLSKDPLCLYMCMLYVRLGNCKPCLEHQITDSHKAVQDNLKKAQN